MSQSNAVAFLLAGTLSAVLAPQAASAQDVPAEGLGVLTEIVVTAQRRTESAQDVPISISAFSVEQLQGVAVQDLPDMAYVTPGLQFQAVGATSIPFLRGVGAATSAAGTESAVPMIVDGVYMAAQGSSLMSLSNIESIEVDKGPQGTLFGRNATGGVIQIRTRKPSHDPRLDFSLGYGNYEAYDGQVYGTVGLSETLAADVALSADRQNDGYGTNLFDGSDVYDGYNYTGRSKFLWTPSDKSEVTALFAYERVRSEVGFATRMPSPGELGRNQRGRSGFQYSGGFHDVNLNFDSGNDSTTKGGSVDWLQDLDFASLRSISAYFVQDIVGRVDFDLGPNDGSYHIYTTEAKTFSQELQLLSNEDAKISWVVGAFYYDDLARYKPAFLHYGQPGVLTDTTIQSQQDTNSWSLFGQSTIPLPAQTRLTLGLRYTNDEREMHLVRTVAGGGAPLTQTGEESFPKLTYRAALDHRFADNVLAFLQASRGFKSGFFNIQTVQGRPGDDTAALPVKPETLDAYEVGIKSDWLSDRLRANASIFYYDYKDQQVNAFLGSTRTLLNAAKSEIYGLDLELTSLVTDNFTLSFVAEYLKAEYKEFLRAPLFVDAPDVGNIASPTNASGNDVVNSPTFTGTLTAKYSIPIGQRDLELSANAYYNDGFYFDFGNTREQDAYTWLNASAKLSFGEASQYDVTVWGANLLDEEVYSSVNQVGRGPGLVAPQFGGDSITTRAPRTYGVRFSAHF